MEHPQLIAKGKVRDLYSTSDPATLLFVASDRISAFDVIMTNGVPNKGKLLTALSKFWFEKLGSILPNHYVTDDLEKMPVEVERWGARSGKDLAGRTMLVRKCEVLKCEAIVRGYLTGSAYKEYCSSSTVHGIKLPSGLPESAKLERPIFTPSTKAAAGEKDENVHPDKLPELLGSDYASLVPLLIQKAIEIFKAAAKHAESVGLILADTKFEFGILPPSESASLADRLILIDEVLTPDSSRYWEATEWEEGKTMTGYDKQALREWLKAGGGGYTGKDGVVIPQDVVDETWKRYCECYQRVTGIAFSL
ncbi:MAG: Bifunctional purine biosynthetic protein ade1 [Cyphobasidiales sp. Tagirdzhanova-0007]|nr:MAG: Bifunctional purine biosynthetic protein ade1 [Cyphobasidiales sp. Tagirdzhanova-0007]